MARRITDKGKDPRVVYADIIDHPHWQSKTHPHMSLYDRAAQFSPFAALTGYNDMINEEARIVDHKVELEEADLEQLNRELNLINEVIISGTLPTAAITYFIPDPLKSGGKYETVIGQIRKNDTARRKLVFMNRKGYANLNFEIDMRDILEIHAM